MDFIEGLPRCGTRKLHTGRRGQVQQVFTFHSFVAPFHYSTGGLVVPGQRLPSAWHADTHRVGSRHDLHQHILEGALSPYSGETVHELGVSPAV
jgi:hypothetical protein